MKEVKRSEIKQTPYENLQFATEVAWAALIDRAIKDSLLSGDARPAGLTYMPTQEITQQFKDACHAVIKDLGVDVKNPNET
jgi:hypothetical protein